MGWTENDNLPKSYLQTTDTPKSFTENIESDVSLTTTFARRMSIGEVAENDYFFYFNAPDPVNAPTVGTWIQKKYYFNGAYVDGRFIHLEKHDKIVEGYLHYPDTDLNDIPFVHWWKEGNAGAGMLLNQELHEEEIIEDTDGVSFMAFSISGGSADEESGATCTDYFPPTEPTAPVPPEPPAPISDGIVPTLPVMKEVGDPPTLRAEPTFTDTPPTPQGPPAYHGPPPYSPPPTDTIPVMPPLGSVANHWVDDVGSFKKPPTYDPATTCHSIMSNSYRYVWDGAYWVIADGTNPDFRRWSVASEIGSYAQLHGDSYGWGDGPMNNVDQTIKDYKTQNGRMTFLRNGLTLAITNPLPNPTYPRLVAPHNPRADDYMQSTTMWTVVYYDNPEYNSGNYDYNEGKVEYKRFSSLQAADDYYDLWVKYYADLALHEQYLLDKADWDAWFVTYSADLAVWNDWYNNTFIPAYNAWYDWYYNTYLPALDAYNAAYAAFNVDHDKWFREKLKYDIDLAAYNESSQDYDAAYAQYLSDIRAYLSELEQYGTQHDLYGVYLIAKDYYDNTTKPAYDAAVVAYNAALVTYLEDLSSWNSSYGITSNELMDMIVTTSGIIAHAQSYHSIITDADGHYARHNWLFNGKLYNTTTWWKYDAETLTITGWTWAINADGTVEGVRVCTDTYSAEPATSQIKYYAFAGKNSSATSPHWYEPDRERLTTLEGEEQPI